MHSATEARRVSGVWQANNLRAHASTSTTTYNNTDSVLCMSCRIVHLHWPRSRLPHAVNLLRNCGPTPPCTSEAPGPQPQKPPKGGRQQELANQAVRHRRPNLCAPCTSGRWEFCCFGFTFLLRCCVSEGGGVVRCGLCGNQCANAPPNHEPQALRYPYRIVKPNSLAHLPLHIPTRTGLRSCVYACSTWRSVLLRGHQCR